MNFEVECREAEVGDEPAHGEVIGRLQGVLIEPGHLPETEEDRYFEVLDMGDAHTAEVLDILVNQRKLIGKALPDSGLLETGNGVALLERAWVSPDYRGKGLALRLMREAKHVLGRFGLLVILKARPDGEDVAAKECLALAAYYKSDEQLGLRELSKRKLPGWLVANWETPDASLGDNLYWTEGNPG